MTYRDVLRFLTIHSWWRACVMKYTVSSSTATSQFLSACSLALQLLSMRSKITNFHGSKTRKRLEVEAISRCLDIAILLVTRYSYNLWIKALRAPFEKGFLSLNSEVKYMKINGTWVVPGNEPRPRENQTLYEWKTPIHVCADTVFVTLSTGVVFLLFTYMHFRWVCVEFYEGGPGERRPPVKWSAIAESFRNTGLNRPEWYTDGYESVLDGEEPKTCCRSVRSTWFLLSGLLVTAVFKSVTQQWLLVLEKFCREVLRSIYLGCPQFVRRKGRTFRLQRGRGMTLTTHPHLVPRSRMSRSSVACSGTVLA
jgi:hypothetical protein